MEYIWIKKFLEIIKSPLSNNYETLKNDTELVDRLDER